MMMTASLLGTSLGYIALTFIPPVLWLILYLREDRNPEPKRLLLLAFVGGMAATPPTWSDEICGYNALTAVLGPQPKLLPDLPNPYAIIPSSRIRGISKQQDLLVGPN